MEKIEELKRIKDGVELLAKDIDNIEFSNKEQVNEASDELIKSLSDAYIEELRQDYFNRRMIDSKLLIDAIATVAHDYEDGLEISFTHNIDNLYFSEPKCGVEHILTITDNNTNVEYEFKTIGDYKKDYIQYYSNEDFDLNIYDKVDFFEFKNCFNTLSIDHNAIEELFDAISKAIDSRVEVNRDYINTVIENLTKEYTKKRTMR